MSHYYALAPRQKAIITKAAYITAAVATAFALTAINVGMHKGASAKTVVDVTACNYTGVLDQFNATMPAGTVKLGANPEFLMTGSSLCAGQMDVSFVLTTTPYTYVNNQLVQLNLNGYPFTEVSRSNVVKPGAFSVRHKGPDFGVNQVVQMRTQVTAYQTTSIDPATNRPFAGAVPLATDEAGWTQTNFVTL